MTGLAPWGAAAQETSTVIAVPAGEHGNVYTVAYALMNDFTVPPYYQITVCGPRDFRAGTLESYLLELEDDDGGILFSMASDAIVDDDFAVAMFNVAPSEVDNVHAYANYYVDMPEERRMGTMERIDFGFVREPGEGREIGARHTSLSCRELADAAAGAED